MHARIPNDRIKSDHVSRVDVENACTHVYRVKQIPCGKKKSIATCQIFDCTRFFLFWQDTLFAYEGVSTDCRLPKISGHLRERAQISETYFP